MDPIIIDAGVVGFNADERLVSGLLLPMGEDCRSSVGRFSFDAGTCSIPVDVPGTMGFNVEHKREESIGRAISAHETPQGIIASFRIADGPDGDKALADVVSGERRYLSAEVKNLRIKAGKAIGATLFGAALVKEPAFASAALFAAADTDDAAADTAEPEGDDLDPTKPHTIGDELANGWIVSDVSQSSYDSDTLGDDGELAPVTRTTYRLVVTKGDETRTAERSVETPREQDNQEEDTVSATATGFAANSTQNQQNQQQEQQGVDATAFFSAIADAQRGHAGALAPIVEEANRVGLFALADVPYTGTANSGALGNTHVPQYLGDIWEADEFEREIIPLFSSGPLTELTFRQTQWTQKAAVGRWAGNKTDIPTQAPKRTASNKSAQRFAGGVDIAREFIDFGHAADVAEIVDQLVQSYKEQSDKYVLEEAIAASTPLWLNVADDLPADVREAHWKIVKGALAVRRIGKANPSFAVLAPDLYEQFLLTPKDKGLEYLGATAGLQDGTFANFKFTTSLDLTPGQVMVGASQSLKVLELPGVPIRVSALDLARGGIDEAVFGYAGVSVQRPQALHMVGTAG